MINLLHEACNVNFESGNVLIRRAGLVASKLKNAGIPIPIIDTALGLYELQICNEPAKAAPYFTAAFNKDSKTPLPLTGLVAAWVQNGEYHNAAKISREIIDTASPVVKNLVKLSRTLAWLDSRTDAVAAPSDAKTLEQINLRPYVGDIVDTAIGRLYLIEGNAAKAAEILIPFAQKRAREPRWRYYAAWAALLTNQRMKVLEEFTASLNEPALWPLACLLMDMDPLLARNNNVQAGFQKVNSAYADAVKVRIALANSQALPSMNWQPGSGTLEEDLEALRIMLGYAFARQKRQLMKETLASPLLLRLPRADQLLWSGLYFLLAGDNTQGQAALEKAASFGWQRAYLVLAVHLLNQKQTRAAQRYLELAASARKDTKIELLRAYIDACEGKVGAAVERLEKLRSGNDPRIQYALGNIYLFRSEEAREKAQADRQNLYLQQAAGAFEAALKKGDKSLPSDCQLLAQCARFAGDPEAHIKQMIAMWSAIAGLTASRRPPWVLWNAILAQLWSANTAMVPAACEEALHLFADLDAIPEAVSSAIARAATVASFHIANSDEIDKIIQFIQHLSSKSPNDAVQACYRLVTTAAARQRYLKASKSEKGGICNYIDKLAGADPGNVGIALLQASVALKNNEKDAAIAAFSNVQPDNDAERQLCACLQGLLQGETVSTELLPETGSGTIPQHDLANSLLQAAILFSDDHPEKGYDSLLKAMNDRAEVVATIIDVEKFLPALCAYSGNRGAIPLQLVNSVRKLVDSVKDEKHALTVARCAAAINEFDDANRLWEKVLAKDKDPNSFRREEFIKFLCYQAVKDNQPDTLLETVARLRFAARMANQVNR